MRISLKLLFSHNNGPSPLIFCVNYGNATQHQLLIYIVHVVQSVHSNAPNKQ